MTLATPSRVRPSPVILGSRFSPSAKPSRIRRKEGTGHFCGWVNSRVLLASIIVANALLTLHFYLVLTEDAPAATIWHSGPIAEIAYVVVITSCDAGHEVPSSLKDAAAVLAESIRRVSYPQHPTARYASKLYGIVHVTAQRSPCASALRQLGYHVLIRDIPTPEPLFHIRRYFPKFNDSRPWILSEPCCGEKEFIKLDAFTLTDHPAAVLLDLDTLFLQPLDDLFDVLVRKDDANYVAAVEHLKNNNLVAPTYLYPNRLGDNRAQWDLPSDIHAFYTRDWTASKAQFSKKRLGVGVQGGFLATRTNRIVYDELKAILEEGNYVLGRGEGSGWGGKGYGKHIYGSMTFQGLMAYYFDVVSKYPVVELHRCRYNLMGDNPRTTFGSKFPRATPKDPVAAGYRDGPCRDGRDDCDDVQCQTWPIEDARTLHFTICQKPWSCPSLDDAGFVNSTVGGTCLNMHRKWFQIRRDVDEGAQRSQGTYLADVFMGNCKGAGKQNYIPMAITQN